MIPLRLVEALSRIPLRPEYVKEAGFPSPEERNAMPARAFADKARTLPCHTKCATWLSAVSHYSQGKRDEQVEAALRKSASYFGIENDVAAVGSMFQPKTEKRASRADDFALKVEDNGETSYLFPILTGSELIKSANSLESTRGRTTYEMRREAALKMVKRAGELELSLPKFVNQAAGVRPKTANQVKKALSLRVSAVRCDADKQRYQELAKAIPDNDDVLPQAEKFATIIDITDRLAGLHHKYANGVETPEEVCFHGDQPCRKFVFKVASSEFVASDVASSSLHIDDLSILGRPFQDKVASAREDDALSFVNGARPSGIDMAKFAVAAQELDGYDARTLRDILRSRGC